MKYIFTRPYWQIAGLFILVKLCLHLLTNTHYELHRDEMLYFNQGDHPGWGNASVPPFIGWIAYIIKAIFGYSVFGIRLLPALLGGASIIIIAKFVADLRGGMIALVLACSAFVLSPGFLIFGTLFTVNAFDQFFWLLIAYLFFKMVRTDNPKLWIWIGIVGGIAFLNKYLVLYLIAGFGAGLLFSPHRKLLFSKYLSLAVAIGLLIITPNLYWQHSHGWPVFFHVAELAKTQMANMTYRNFLIDLFDLNYVTTFFWLAGFGAVLVLTSEKQHRYLGIATLTVLLLIMLTSGKAYYLLGLIPVLFAISGYILEKYFTKRRAVINYLVWAMIVVFSTLAIPFALPVLSFEKLSQYSEKTAGFVSYPFSRWEDGKIHHISQVFSDMTGWEELASLVNRAYQQIPQSERQNCTIYAERNYGYAGAVHFYGRQHALPAAITFLDSYVLWAPDSIAKGPLIYIHYEIGGLEHLFEKCIVVGAVENPYFRENGVKVFLCRNPNENLQAVYNQKAKAEKTAYCP